VPDRPPPDDVLAAYGLAGSPAPLDGGQGRTFVLDGVVLQPAPSAAEAEWTAELLDAIVPDGFRVARPVPSRDGGWVVGGWCAFEEVPGTHRLWDAHWPDAVEVSQRFHRALAGVARPGFLAQRQSPLALADRVAWGEERLVLPEAIAAPVDGLATRMRPVRSPYQLVHGDLAGNLLYADGLDPAVIDLSWYWRPAGYGTAMVVVDAVLWYGAGTDLIAAATRVPELDQLLARALTFRLVVDALLAADNPGVRWDESQVRWDLDHAAPLLAWLAADRDAH
jgi:uncharacterized protein (TIGR02569 family)